MNETQGDPGPSFEDRLRSARGKQGLDVNASDNSVPSNAWGVGMKVGVEMVSALVIGVGIGWWLDRWLHTLPLFLSLFVLLGGAAGILNVWRSFAPPDRRGRGKT